MLRDPLIRLVMDSDGVTELEMIAVMDQLRHALAAREARMHHRKNWHPVRARD